MVEHYLLPASLLNITHELVHALSLLCSERVALLRVAERDNELHVPVERASLADLIRVKPLLISNLKILHNICTFLFYYCLIL